MKCGSALCSVTRSEEMTAGTPQSLPASLPQIFTGFRIALGRALTITIALELVSCPDGLGSMIWIAWQTFYTEKLYLGVFLSAILGTVLHFSLKRLEAKLVPWKN